MVSSGTPAADDDLDLNSKEQQKRRDVRRLLSLYWRLLAPYVRLEKRARWDVATVLGMAFLQNGISVWISFISRDFWSALNTKDQDLFLHQAGIFAAVLAAAVPAIVYYGYVRDMAALRWREWLTTKILGEYTENRAFYDIDQDGKLDNPDQRISSDLATFTRDSLMFNLQIVTSSIDMISFSAILYSIYPQLFILLIGYAATGTAATLWFGKSFVALNRRQLVREADFRYALIRLRENAESIAFFGGERRERTDLSRRLKLVTDNMTQLIGWQRNLGFLQVGYRKIVQLVPALAVSPRYFRGEIPLGVVTQSFSAFSHIFNDLSLVVSKFDQLSQLGAQLGRIQELTEAVERKVPKEACVFGNAPESSDSTRKDSTGAESATAESTVVESAIAATTMTASMAATSNVAGHLSEIEVRDSNDSSLTLQSVSLFTPSENNPRLLIDGINLTLPPGGRLLIAGPSGVGKSSLVRSVAGLWKSGTGVIVRPRAEDVFFLPQRPYCTLGSLADNLVYPKRIGVDTDIPSDQELLEYLDFVGLQNLPDRMGGLQATCDWGDTLSLGEQQRLSFARLLIFKPKLAVIDEGTSALDLRNEERLYNKLRELNVTVVSIGHRPSLIKYHDTILRLSQASDGWAIETIRQEQRDRVIAEVL